MSQSRAVAIATSATAKYVAFRGHQQNPATVLLTTAKGTRFNVQSNAERITQLRQEDATIAKGNAERVESLKQLVNGAVSSFSASSLNVLLLNQENLEENCNVVVSTLIPTVTNQG